MIKHILECMGIVNSAILKAIISIKFDFVGFWTKNKKTFKLIAMIIGIVIYVVGSLMFGAWLTLEYYGFAINSMMYTWLPIGTMFVFILLAWYIVAVGIICRKTKR